MAARPTPEDERFQRILARQRRDAAHSAARAALGMTTPPSEPTLLAALVAIIDAPEPGAKPHPRLDRRPLRGVGGVPPARSAPVRRRT
jgi:hypothetical protein